MQLRTRWDADRRRLATGLERAAVPTLRPGEILVEMLFVPFHGSFWLASHPDGLHPRRDEFVRNGSFVFGSGGVGRVREVRGRQAAEGAQTRNPRPGDFVALFGHLPCSNHDCHACQVQHRYVECNFGQGQILGHGGGAPDGSYARFAVLPPLSYEVCYRDEERPTREQLRAMMFAYLFADVRNALRRWPDTAGRERLLLVGAGQCGTIAAHLHLSESRRHRLVVADLDRERARRVQALAPEEVEIFPLPGSPEALAEMMRRHFHGQRCNLVFDASSGHSSPLWADPRVVGPGCQCIPFGFGGEGIQLTPAVLQQSGLSVTPSRGVGDRENRREVIARLRGDWADLSLRLGGRRLPNLESALDFIRAQHEPPLPLAQIEPAYFTPNEAGAAT